MAVSIRPEDPMATAVREWPETLERRRMSFAEFEDVHWWDQTPILAVEILSPSTRNEEMLRKPQEYAVAGIAQYWTVDRERHTMTVVAASPNDPGARDIVLELDADHPRGEVAVGDHGVVALDLDELLAG